MDGLWDGLLNVLSFQGLFYVALGMALGLVVGSLPGLSATMAIAILLPITYGMDPAYGIAMLTSLYMGGMYGGSILAILVKTPGTPAAAATVLDGYELAKQGKAGKALGISLVASTIGGIIGAIILLLFAPLLGQVALQIGVREMFAVAILGITIISSLSAGSATKGLLAGMIGLLISLIGMDPISGIPRFTFGSVYLFDGISFIVALIGLFSIPQALKLMATEQEEIKASKITDRILPRFRDVTKHWINYIRSGLIGVVTGLIPGTGGETASWFAYNESKRFSKEKDKFGTGHKDGIIAPEAANNAVVGGALVPTITLGVPGSSTTAVLLGALMIHGITPGPTLMTEHGDIAYTLLWALLISAIFMFFIGLLYLRFAVGITRIPGKILGPIILVMAIVGTFAVQNSMTDVLVMFGFGIVGYFMNTLKIPVAPLVIGMILGVMADTSLNQALSISRGDWSIFLSSPVAVVLLIIAFISILQATPLFGYIKKLITNRSK